MHKYDEKNKNKEEKRNMILSVIVIILLIISLIILFYLIRERFFSTAYSDKPVSDRQEEINIDIDHNTDEDAYTELMGFGTLQINKANPNVYLINPETNEVNLSFDVYYDDEVIYSSDLIEPGRMEQFDVYSCLNAGKHTLVYSISSYEKDTNAVLWSGVQQKQDIQIRK